MTVLMEAVYNFLNDSIFEYHNLAKGKTSLM